MTVLEDGLGFLIMRNHGSHWLVGWFVRWILVGAYFETLVGRQGT